MKGTLVVSFSGGKTSGYMAAELKLRYGETHNLVYLFANTGCENEATLEFVNRCDKHYRLGVVWLEAVVHPTHGKGITHRVTSFAHACRPRDYSSTLHPFHAFICKSGVPNSNKPQCSDRLKMFPIEHYKKMRGLQGAQHAIGIRVDELRRVVSPRVQGLLADAQINAHEWRLLPSYARKRVAAECLLGTSLDAVLRYSGKLSRYGLVYPLCDWFPSDKIDVNDWWDTQPFTLELEEHEGNCQTCWKKSQKKLALLALEHPERFDAFDWWERTYQHVKPNTNGTPRVFFRGNRSARAVLAEAAACDSVSLRMAIGADPDAPSGCSESCEAYGNGE